jgi:autotransporter translocation and assembly factor TamB
MLQRRVSPAKKYLRRTLQIVAFVGTILVGIIALALIASQTPWFHNWLRKFAVREAKQYVNGDVSIGSLGGDLFYGIELGDVVVDVNGEHIITLKKLEVKYSIAELIGKGVTIREIKLDEPFVQLRHDASGWNLARLVKRQQQEANRQGPSKSVSLPDIEIVGGHAAVDDRAPSPSFRIPSRIDGLNLKGAFAYEPVHYSVTIDQLALRGAAPDLTVTKLTGGIATRQDDLYLDKIFLQTGQSSMTVDGAIQKYLSTPSLKLTVSTPHVSIPEFAGVLPPVKGYDLHPSFDAKVDGALSALQIATNMKSEAGVVSGTVTADLQAPDLGAKGDLSVQNLNLAPILRNLSQKCDITGSAKIDLRVPGSPASASAMDRLRGHIVFTGPSVTASGYHATDVSVTADLAGHRINLDGRAKAYGGSATAKGFIETPASTGAPTRLDLAGSASHVNLADLPKTVNAPRLATNINATAYHITGSFGRASSLDGSVTLDRSQLAGGTILPGTTGTFSMTMRTGRPGLESLSYSARGAVRNVNIQRVGEAFQIAALNTPRYDSRVNTTFDVKGSGASSATAAAMHLDATGTATDSQIFGATLPKMAYEAHLADNGLKGHATGDIQHLDPAVISGNDRVKGTVNGSVDVGFGIANLSAPMTPDAITADGRVTLGKSEIAGLAIDTADIQGQYANRAGNLRQASIKGPDIEVTASGPIALDQAGQSNVKYHVVATNLADLGKLANQPIGGAATIDGTVTGNASSLATKGTLDGSNLAYKDDKALDLDSTYTITLPSLDVAHLQIQAQTRGTFIDAGALHLNSLTATTTYADKKLDFQTHLAEAPAGAEAEAAAGQKSGGARELDASGSVIFHPDHQEIHLPSLAIRTQGVEWRSAPGSAAAVQYGNDRIQVQGLQLVNGQQSLSVDGAFALGDAPTLEGVKVTAQHVDISQLERLAMQNRGLTGTLDANAEIAGSAKAPAVTGHVAVTNGAFQQVKYQSLTVDGTYNGSRIGVDAKLVQSPGVELTAKGTMPLSLFKPNPPGVTGHVAASNGDAINLHVQSSSIDLGIVQGFTPEVTNVTGTLQADVTVTGSGEDPHLDGYVAIQNGAFRVVEGNTRFSGLTTRIELQPDRIHVPRLQILDQHGAAMTIEGDLAVHEKSAGAVNVSVQAKDFKIIDNDLGKIALDSNLKLTGDIRHPRVEGDLSFPAARLELDKLLLQFASKYSTEALPEVVSAENTTGSDKGADQATQDALNRGRQIGAQAAPKANATAPEAAPQGGVFGALQLNIHVTAPDDFVVRGSDLRPGGPTAAQIGNVNATVGANIRVQKVENGPITLRGTANTVRGFYEFQGRRFTIDRDGTAQFHGEAQINPDIDVTAERLIPNTGVTAKVHVTGTAKAPQIALTSDPPLDEADILSLVIFNRSVNDLGTGERASLAETAGGIASGFVASSLGKSVGKALDVDLFEITTSDPTTGETAGGVTLGKQVSDKAFVQFQQQFGQRSFTQFMLDYQLAKFLRLQTRIAPETSGVANRVTEKRVERAGVDLIFFFSY